MTNHAQAIALYEAANRASLDAIRIARLSGSNGAGLAAVRRRDAIALRKRAARMLSMPVCD